MVGHARGDAIERLTILVYPQCVVSIPSSPALAHHTKILPATDDDGGAERCKRESGHLHRLRHGARSRFGQVLVKVLKPALLRGGRRGCGRVVGGGLLLGERGFGHG